jgi:hypothetical protein
VVAALALGAIVLIGFLVWLLAVAGGDSDEKATEASAPLATTAPPTTAAPVPVAPGEGRSPEVAFAPIPGFTFEAAPPDVVSDIRSGFEEGLSEGTGSLPGVQLDTEEVVAGIAARSVVQDGDTVAVAGVLSIDDQWAARIPPGAMLSGFEEAFATTQPMTIRGERAIYVEEQGTGLLFSYKDGMVLLIGGDPADRGTLRDIMAGLLDNLG